MSYNFDPNGRGSQTNVIYTGRTAGTLTNNFNFYGVSDRMTVYYGTNQIQDTGTVSGPGNFTASYGPGSNTSMTVIMNEGNDYPPSTWEYHLSLLAPLYYQWRFNSTNISGATNATYTLASVLTNQAGNYTVLVSDSTGNVPSPTAQLTVAGVAAYVGGQLIVSTQYAFAGSVNIQLQTGFAGGSIYYTLDGSVPTIASLPYTGSIALGTNATLRALAYSSDFSQTAEGWSIIFAKVSGFTLTTVNAGGGSITLTPPSGVYLSNTIVNVAATPSAGWAFLGWLGDASGNNLTNSVKLDRDRTVEAVFGTTVTATTNSSGTISLSPAAALYPFGTVVRVTASPLTGKYFGIWSGGASGDVNPLYFPVTNANPTISAGFPLVSAGQVALTVAATGLGQVTVNAPANVYPFGNNVTLTATPESGQTFISWTNDASGTSNPLVVTMVTNKLITAQFTKRSFLTDVPPLGGLTESGLRLTLAGELGGQFQLEASTNLTNWAVLTTLTNTMGRMQFTDPAVTNTPARFYRAVQLP